MRRLAQRRSARRADGCFVAEGVKVLDAAFDAGARVEAVYHAPQALEHPGATAVLERALRAGTRVFALGPGVLERVADAATPQPVCGVLAFVDVPLAGLLAHASGLVVVAVEVRDPGNLGALLRVADAAGASGVVLCEGSADLYNPKTVRATAGSLFNVPVALAASPVETISVLRAAGYRCLGAVARGGEDYDRAELSGRVALVFGNEANGLDEETTDALDGLLSIPMGGRAESLNVAMAATVLCFEIARRSRAGKTPVADALP